MSEHLSEYGEVRFSYTGHAGVLTVHDGTQHNCRFEAGQLETGEVVLLCILADPQFFFGVDATAFRGIDESGWLLEADSLHNITYLPAVQQPGSYIACHANRLIATRPEQAKLHQLRFGMTNLRFTGTEGLVERDAAGQPRRAERVLRVNLTAPSRPSVSVMIQNAPPTRTARMLGISRNTAITAEAIVQQHPQLDETRPVIDDLAVLFSIARGTRIQAVYVEARSDDGAAIQRIHQPGLGRAFNSLVVLTHTHEHANPTRRFVENGYPLLMSRGAELNLLGGILQAYIDARSEHDFLELRGVKFAIVAEMLKAAYLNHLFPSGTPRQRMAFRKVLERLLSHAGLTPTPRELMLFVRSRNALIHEGRFYVQAATADERRSVPPYQIRWPSIFSSSVFSTDSS